MDNNTENKNPLLTPFGTPYGAVPYDRITLDHYVPAVADCIKKEESVIENICSNSQKATFENTEFISHLP